MANHAISNGTVSSNPNFLANRTFTFLEIFENGKPRNEIVHDLMMIVGILRGEHEIPSLYMINGIQDT